MKSTEKLIEMQEENGFMVYSHPVHSSIQAINPSGSKEAVLETKTQECNTQFTILYPLALATIHRMFSSVDLLACSKLTHLRASWSGRLCVFGINNCPENGCPRIMLLIEKCTKP